MCGHHAVLAANRLIGFRSFGLSPRPSAGAIVDGDQVARAAAVLGDQLHHVPLPTGHSVRREARPAAEAAVAAALARADATSGAGER